jgi:hypothetical protein
MAQTLVGLFHSQGDAQGAVQELTEAGIAREDVGYAEAGADFDALVKYGIPDEVAPHFATALRRGDAVVSVQVSDAQMTSVGAVFTRHNAADVKTSGLSAEAIARGQEEMAHIAPGPHEPLHFGNTGTRTQVSEDPISEVNPFQETRP